jgi:excinuclease ABC subunit A
MRVIAVADHVIDLGPGAGDASGSVVAAGTTEHVADKGVGASAGYLTRALHAAINVTPS